MSLRIVSIALALMVAACGTPAAQPGTGIQGMVQAGPTCPVERIDSPCPPRPLAATVVVRVQHERAVPCNRLPDGLTAEDQHLQIGRTAFLREVGRDANDVAGPKGRELARADGGAF